MALFDKDMVLITQQQGVAQKIEIPVQTCVQDEIRVISKFFIIYLIQKTSVLNEKLTKIIKFAYSAIVSISMSMGASKKSKSIR